MLLVFDEEMENMGQKVEDEEEGVWREEDEEEGVFREEDEEEGV